jgi:hypothetical protein
METEPPTAGPAQLVLVPPGGIYRGDFETITLVCGALPVVSGGGGFMDQALAAGRVCVAAPAGGSDQPDRLRRCEEAGIVVASPLCAEALADRTLAVLGDDERMAAIRQRVERSGLRNGLPHALTLVEGLLGEEARELRPIGNEVGADGRRAR